MKKLVMQLATVLTMGLTMTMAHAADAAEAADTAAPSARQGKIKTCSMDAQTKSLAGAERKAFMRKCLGTKPPGAAGSRGG